MDWKKNIQELVKKENKGTITSSEFNAQLDAICSELSKQAHDLFSKNLIQESEYQSIQNENKNKIHVYVDAVRDFQKEEKSTPSVIKPPLEPKKRRFYNDDLVGRYLQDVDTNKVYETPFESFFSFMAFAQSIFMILSIYSLISTFSRDDVSKVNTVIVSLKNYKKFRQENPKIESGWGEETKASKKNIELLKKLDESVQGLERLSLVPLDVYANYRKKNDLENYRPVFEIGKKELFEKPDLINIKRSISKTSVFRDYVASQKTLFVIRDIISLIGGIAISMFGFQIWMRRKDDIKEINNTYENPIVRLFSHFLTTYGEACMLLSRILAVTFLCLFVVVGSYAFMNELYTVFPISFYLILSISFPIAGFSLFLSCKVIANILITYVDIGKNIRHINQKFKD